jgi:hypothetical protein
MFIHPLLGIHSLTNTFKTPSSKISQIKKINTGSENTQTGVGAVHIMVARLCSFVRVLNVHSVPGLGLGLGLGFHHAAFVIG